MRLISYILFISILAFGSCESDSKQANSTKTATSRIDNKVVSERLDNATFAQKLKATPDALLIDVRTPQEFQAGHLDGAVNYDYHNDKFNEQIMSLDKMKPTFIYCQSGGRSGKTLTRMKTMGFQKVYELKTGYGGWDK